MESLVDSGAFWYSVLGAWTITAAWLVVVLLTIIWAILRDRLAEAAYRRSQTEDADEAAWEAVNNALGRSVVELRELKADCVKLSCECRAEAISSE